MSAPSSSRTLAMTARRCLARRCGGRTRQVEGRGGCDGQRHRLLGAGTGIDAIKAGLVPAPDSETGRETAPDRTRDSKAAVGEQVAAADADNAPWA